MMGTMEVDNLHMSDQVDVSEDGSRPRPLRGRRSYKRVHMLFTMPSYTLKVGSKNVRHENRFRSWHLLRKLVLQQNWVDASGVLSALLKGTCREKLPQNNRMMYWVAMELLQKMESDPNTYSLRIGHLYDTWKEKIKSHKKRQLKDRSVILEYILSCLARNRLDFARNSLHSLQQEHESLKDLKSNLIMGLANYDLWYCDLPKEMRQGNLEESCMRMESKTVMNNSSKEIDNGNEEDAASIYETFSILHYLSETSVVNDKDKLVEHNQKSQSQDFHVKSSETSVENDGSIQDDYYEIHSSSTYSNLQSLQSLLPLRVSSPENILDVLSSRGQSSSDHYKEALKFLKLALQSPRPISEAALLPLIQLLLIGGHAKEAIIVLEQFCCESSSMLPFRLKARIWECFDADNYDKLTVCFEDVLKKDPLCRHSLTRLIDLHIKGEYATERLVEMIALHLEASYGDHTSWREFALCLLKLSQCEEDRLSMCVGGEQVESERMHTIHICRTPASFVEGVSGKTWKFRCKWWLNRHFSKQLLTSEMAEGDLKLMSYKAACASHLYGKEMEYVVRVLSYVNEHDRILLSFLHSHIQNSVGFFSNLVSK